MITTILNNKYSALSLELNTLVNAIKEVKKEMISIKKTDYHIKEQINTLSETFNKAKNSIINAIGKIDTSDNLEDQIISLLFENMGIKPVEKTPLLNIDNIVIAPNKFQYKIIHGKAGCTGSLVGVNWNTDLCGVIHVWTDPTDNTTYCINGHNRLNLARKCGIKEVFVKYIDCDNADQAKLIGALINISENSGTILDAAKIFKDYGLTPADLKEKYNISLSNKTANKGLILSRLENNLFDKVITGDLDLDIALSIADKILDHDSQLMCYSLITKHKTSLDNNLIGELVDMIANQSSELKENTLFGEVIDTNKMIMRLTLCNYVTSKLGQNKRLFSSVSKNSDKLQKANNIIDKNSSENIALLSEFMLDIFNKFKNLSGGIANLINDVLNSNMSLSKKKELLLDNILHYAAILHEHRDDVNILNPNSKLFSDMKIINKFIENIPENNEHTLVLNVLKESPKNFDQLLISTKLTADQLSVALIELELNGVINKIAFSWGLATNQVNKRKK